MITFRQRNIRNCQKSWRSFYKYKSHFADTRSDLVFRCPHVPRRNRFYGEGLHALQTKWRVRPVKTQISLGIRPVWSEPSLFELLSASEDSGQTGWMPRLIWVFAGRSSILLILSWGGSNIKSIVYTLQYWDAESPNHSFRNLNKLI